MQTRFAVQVLALEAQVLRGVPVYRRALAQAAAPGSGSSAPDGVAVAVGHAVRQAVQFRVIPEDIRVLTVAVDARQRFIAVFGVDILHRRVRVTVAGFTHHLQAGPGVLRAFRFTGMASPHLFLRTAAWRVVAVFCFCELRVTVDFHPADAVLVVIAEALRHSPVRVVARPRPGSLYSRLIPSKPCSKWHGYSVGRESDSGVPDTFSPGSSYRRWLSDILNTKWIHLQHVTPLITSHYQRALIMAEHDIGRSHPFQSTASL